MSKRGPKPMPTNVRELFDTRKPSTAAENEPVVPVEVPPTPDGLSPAESSKFVEIATLLAGMRVMSKADVDAVVLYVRNWQEAVEARLIVEQMGIVIQSPNNYPILNPYVPVYRKAEERCLRILTEFGLTPSSRVRVNTL